VRQRGMVNDWQHPLHDGLRLVTSPVKLSTTPVRTPDNGGLPPPLLGQHTEEVLRGVLNYSAHELAQLKKNKVI
jgi:crotonobetainyl-CoA:carnitine CoA-transferase CaiB-like acyl-CoA transferase